MEFRWIDKFNISTQIHVDIFFSSAAATFRRGPNVNKSVEKLNFNQNNSNIARNVIWRSQESFACVSSWKFDAVFVAE